MNNKNKVIQIMCKKSIEKCFEVSFLPLSSHDAPIYRSDDFSALESHTEDRSAQTVGRIPYSQSHAL